MQREIDFSTMPSTYQVCWHSQCPLKENCLRHLAASHLPADMPFVGSINLNHVNPFSGQCKMQRPVRYVRIAWGLKHIYDNLTYKQKDAIYGQIHRGLGNTTYYHYYNERKPIPPHVKAYIQDVFQRHGITEPVVFRRYEEILDW